MIFIGIGGNISFGGQPVLTTLNAALSTMPEYGIRVDKCSSFYHSRPVPVSDQPWFFNAVVSCTSHHSPHEVLRALLSIEKKFGRIRTDSTIKNSARTLDLDIIDFDGKIISDDTLDLPHPRLTSRAFILLPLQEIAPDWRHPVSGEPVCALVKGLSPEDCANTIRV